MFGWLRTIWGRRAAREMDCPELRREASAFLDGELPPQRQEQVRRHLGGCGPCRAFVEGLRSTIGLLQGLTRKPAPPTLQSRVLQRIHEEGSSSPST